jgi:hypothetical protein
MEFVKFTEENDWEGETWRFYLQLEGNEEALDELTLLVEKMENWGEESYSLDLDPLEEEEVDILVKHSDSGYMDYHQKVEGFLEIPDNANELSEEDLFSLFYKGGIRKLFEE